MKLKKQDILLLAGLLVIFLVLGAVLLLTRENGATVVVRVAGEETAAFRLDKTTTYIIDGANGGTNELIIENGEVWLNDASCPDQLCVHQGKIRYVGESIICLPNQVSVTIEGEPEEDGVDVIAT